MAPAASRPATTDGTTPVASATTIPTRTTIASRAPRPERHDLAPDLVRLVDDEDVRAGHVLVERRPRSLEQQDVTDGEDQARRGPAPRPCAGSARMTRSPLSVTMPGKTVSPTRPDRGGITTSATPDARLIEGQLVVEPVLLDERQGVPAEVGRDQLRRPGRQQALAEQHDDHDRPDDQRDADEGELEEPERRAAVGRRRLRDDHVDRRPGERQHRAGVGAEHQRHQQLRRRPAEADARSRRRPAAARRPRR